MRAIYVSQYPVLRYLEDRSDAHRCCGGSISGWFYQDSGGGKEGSAHLNQFKFKVMQVFFIQVINLLSELIALHNQYLHRPIE